MKWPRHPLEGVSFYETPKNGCFQKETTIEKWLFHPMCLHLYVFAFSRLRVRRLCIKPFRRLAIQTLRFFCYVFFHQRTDRLAI